MPNDYIFLHIIITYQYYRWINKSAGGKKETPLPAGERGA